MGGNESDTWLLWWKAGKTLLCEEIEGPMCVGMRTSVVRETSDVAASFVGN